MALYDRHGTPGFECHTPHNEVRSYIVSVYLLAFSYGVGEGERRIQEIMRAGSPSSDPMWKVLGFSRWSYWALVCLNYLAISAVCAANMLSRFYFAHGGSRRWLSTWLQSAGFPILLLPLMACYRAQARRPFETLTAKTALACCGLGLLQGVDNFMFAWGISYLSVSTYSLLSASQLAFNAVFAFLVAGHRLGSSTVNAVVVLTLGAVLAGFASDRERAEAPSGLKYATGILTTVGAAALYGLILPVIEVVYGMMKCRATYAVVLETQAVISAAATVFSTVGMWANGDFAGMRREARRDFDAGERKYYMTVAWTAISWQAFFVGTAGMIFLTTSLVSGILMAALLPASLVAAVVFFHDGFNGEKGVAMVLSLWGFASYLYGQHAQRGDNDNNISGGRGDVRVSNREVDKTPSKGQRELSTLFDDTISTYL